MTAVCAIVVRRAGGWIGRRLRTKRRIGALVFLLFIAVLVIAWVLPINYIYTPPSVELDQSLYGGIRLSTYPTVTYQMDVMFSAAGSFSVGNPVHVRVDLTHPNNTQFLNSYCCATLTNAVNIPPIMGKGNASNTVFGDRIYLTAYSNGSYIGDASIRFVQPGSQNITLALPPNLTNPIPIIVEPGFAGGLPYPYNLSKSNGIITVSDSSATLSIDTTRFVARITILVGAFSVVLLQPVLEAILLQPDEWGRLMRQRQAPEPRQDSPPPSPTLSPGQMRRKEHRLQERLRKEEKNALEESD